MERVDIYNKYDVQKQVAAQEVTLTPSCTSEDQHVLYLSERDAVRVAELLENPPKPNEAAVRAARMFMKNYG